MQYVITQPTKNGVKRFLGFIALSFQLLVLISFITPSQQAFAADNSGSYATNRVKKGNASYYSRQFHGKPTASGEIFDMNIFSAASNVFPLGTWLAISRPGSDKCITLKVNDRMAASTGAKRILDLSLSAAKSLGILAKGVAQVEARILSSDAVDSKSGCQISAEDNTQIEASQNDEQSITSSAIQIVREIIK
jgi:rare lipoprotein A (peptidoglycan hydrolase)